MRKVILDVDTGSDDAIAIMLACYCRQVEVVGICSVDGSRPVDNATDNTLRVLHLVGREDIPVYRGCPGPMVKEIYKDRIDVWNNPKYRPVFPIRERARFHIDFDYLDEAEVTCQNTPAVSFYVDYLRNTKEKVTLVATGPLTNLGMAFRIAPDIVNNIEELVIMGGGDTITNISSSAEGNIWRDPEAAARVLASGANIILVPCDATHRGYITAEEADEIAALGSPAAEFTSKLCHQRILAHTITQPLEVPDSAAIHDALAFCYVLDPTVLKDVREVHCEIGLRDFSDGQTIIDPRFYDEEHNCRFAYDADREKFIRLMKDIFANSVEA